MMMNLIPLHQSIYIPSYYLPKAGSQDKLQRVQGDITLPSPSVPYLLLERIQRRAFSDPSLRPFCYLLQTAGDYSCRILVVPTTGLSIIYKILYFESEYLFDTATMATYWTPVFWESAHWPCVEDIISIEWTCSLCAQSQPWWPPHVLWWTTKLCTEHHDLTK